MKFGSIAETGAKAGDKVKCVGETPTAMRGRFHVGSIYDVKNVCGVPQAYGHHKDTLVTPAQPVCWRGFGFEWEIVE